MSKQETSEKYSMKGWDLLTFLKGRKKLLVTGIGGLVGYITTQNPAFTALAAASAELLYALIDYYLKE